MGLRFKITPNSTGDIPPLVAARHMGMTLAQFIEVLNRPGDGFLARGFPPPDPTSGNFDLDAINVWRRARYPQAFALTAPSPARDARAILTERRRALDG